MVRGSASSPGPKSPEAKINGPSAVEDDKLTLSIIETIRRIRAQKQRPSLERITKWVMNRTAARDCSYEDVHSRLEELSSSGKVLKVFNQGEYSYRDPETMTPRACGRASKQWKETCENRLTPKKHKISIASPTSPKIASPELTLIPRNPLMRHKTLQIVDYIKLVQISLDGLRQPQGATVKDMGRYLETTYYIQGISAIEFCRHLRLACKRGVHAGRLIKDGHIFCLAPNALQSNSPETSSKISNGVKEDHATYKHQPSATPLPVCSYCRGTAQCNKVGENESLLSCVDCGNSGHPSCMKFSSDLAAKVRNLRWQCIECKSCTACGSKGNADNLLFCDSCDRGFHMECCSPPLNKMPKGSFVCEICKHEGVGEKRSETLFHAGREKSLPRGTGRPPSVHRRLSTSAGTSSTSLAKSKRSTSDVDEAPHEVLTESGQHYLQVPYNKKPKGLIDGMTKFFTPSMGGRKTFTSQLRTTPLMIMHHMDESSEVGASDFNDVDMPPSKDGNSKSCKANITEQDENMFFQAREESLQRTGVVEGENPDPSSVRCPASIEFGKYSIETWYSSPYPQEYARLQKLYICEFCLKYMKSPAILQRHSQKCPWFHPPANEIYRSNDLSVFEVDGNVSKIYCQNLCLLAKLFLDHKTLYYDVEPFSFYCLTKNDSKGCHLIGYFSKEKHCQQKYNVSCIMTMPQYQRQGFGRFLIDFSYLLSRKEGQTGSPEKPLSDLGQVSYNAYWKSALLDYLSKQTNENHMSLRDISKATGICPHDIASTLQKLGMIAVKESEDDSSEVRFNLKRQREIVVEYERKKEAMMNDPSRPPRATVDPDCLRWTPLVASLSDEPGLASPTPTPEKRLPSSPGTRFNLSPVKIHESQLPLENGISSDVEDVDVTGPTPPDKTDDHPASNLPPAEPAAPCVAEPEVASKMTEIEKPKVEKGELEVVAPVPKMQIDISKGLILPSTAVHHRKRGRPRKHALVPAKIPAPSASSADCLKSAPLMMSPRKKRRRKVKGYPWGSVKKKKKKPSNIPTGKAEGNDVATRGNGWRLGGPHFSSDSEDDSGSRAPRKKPTAEDEKVLKPSQSMTSDERHDDEASFDQPRPEVDSAQPEKAFAAAPSPRKIKRRKRKAKGYQWGPVKKKIKRPVNAALHRMVDGAVVKRKGPGRPRKIVLATNLPVLTEPSPAATGKGPTQTTMDQFLHPKPNRGAAATNSNSNNANNARSDHIGSAASEVKLATLCDKHRVVVASVTVSPQKPRRVLSPKLPLLGAPELRHRSKKNSPGRLQLQPKLRRRSAIAGENFVASCLISNRSPKRGAQPEKKRPRGRPRSSFRELRDINAMDRPNENERPDEEADVVAGKASPGILPDTNGSFLAHGPHMQSSELMGSSLNTTEGTVSTVAFAKPWIPALGSSSSNVAQPCRSTFTLVHDCRFKDMSFHAANRQPFKRGNRMESLNLRSPSLTTYRDMTRHEDNDTSSSSDAESSCLSSAESFSDNTSDDELDDTRLDDSERLYRQWRGNEKTKTNEPTAADASAAASLYPIVRAQAKASDFDVGASKSGVQSSATTTTTTTKKKAVEGLKRGRGRPRKYPPKEQEQQSSELRASNPKGKAKKRRRKEKPASEPALPSRLTLKVHRTSDGYTTSPFKKTETEVSVDEPDEHERPSDVDSTSGNCKTDVVDRTRTESPTRPESPSVAEVDVAVSSHRTPEDDLNRGEIRSQPQSDENGAGSDSDEDSVTLEKEEKTLRRHGDPTLPTWFAKCQASKDSWEGQSPRNEARSPDARHESSMNSLTLEEDSSFSDVFASIAGVRPPSAMSSSVGLPRSADDVTDISRDADTFADEVKPEEPLVSATQNDPWSVTNKLPTSTSEEDEEINAAVASITQLSGSSPLGLCNPPYVTNDQECFDAHVPVDDVEPGLPLTPGHPVEANSPSSVAARNVDQILEPEHKPSPPAVEPTTGSHLREERLERNLAESPVVEPGPEFENSLPSISVPGHSELTDQPTSDLAQFARRDMEQTIDASSLVEAPPAPPCQTDGGESSGQYTDGITDPGYRNNDAENQSYVESNDLADMQQSFVPSQPTDMPMPPAQQCQYAQPDFGSAADFSTGVTDGGESCYTQNFQQEVTGGYQSEIYQHTYQNQEQAAYEQPYNDSQPMYSSSCMAQDNQAAAQCEVTDDSGQNALTSPQPNFSQSAMPAVQCRVSADYGDPPGADRAVLGTPCAMNQMQSVPATAHAHGYAPVATGGSGSTSGYETQSNNSCSPYTSPESLNPGSCDHTISTTASAQHVEGTYAHAQAPSSTMSAGVQQQYPVTPAIMYSAPSNDSGHGSEYLSSPPSLGMSCQGTPPKPAMQQQPTLLSPEPYPPARQQQQQGPHSQAASYNNLPSPSLGPQQGVGSRRGFAMVGDSTVGTAPPNSLPPCMVQRLSPPVVKTPTTPVCAFPGQMDEAFANQGPPVDACQIGVPGPDPSPSPTPGNPNSLMKLQQLTHGISGVVVENSSAGAAYTTQSSSFTSANDAFTPPQPTAVRRTRYPCSAVPDRPASVQPSPMANADKYPHLPSTPPASVGDTPGGRSGYYPAGIAEKNVSRYDRDVRHSGGVNPSYGQHPLYSGREWQTMSRQHSVPGCGSGYEHGDWHGGFDRFSGYGHQAAPCQIPPHYPFNCPQPPNYVQGNVGSFQHGASLPNPVLMPPTGQPAYQARKAEHYARGSTYGPLGVRAPFSGHDVGPGLPYPSGSPYDSYVSSQTPGYHGASFSYR